MKRNEQEGIKAKGEPEYESEYESEYEYEVI